MLLLLTYNFPYLDEGIGGGGGVSSCASLLLQWLLMRGEGCGRKAVGRCGSPGGDRGSTLSGSAPRDAGGSTESLEEVSLMDGGPISEDKSGVASCSGGDGARALAVGCAEAGSAPSAAASSRGCGDVITLTATDDDEDTLDGDAAASGLGTGPESSESIFITFEQQKINLLVFVPQFVLLSRCIFVRCILFN